MRKNIIAGNWKMNTTPTESSNLAKSIISAVNGFSRADIVICPPFTSLCAVADAIRGSNVKLGAQNVHWAESGAFTGEVSAAMLAELGVEYVIVGHSERREYFGDTDLTVNKRAKAALESGLTPIICVGETLEQRESGQTNTVLQTQVEGSLEGFTQEMLMRSVIAYEPVWAIGTGRTATAGDANSTIEVIRECIAELLGKESSQRVRIQYGGSMNEKNCGELLTMPNIDGGLIGGASLKPGSFASIVESANT